MEPYLTRCFENPSAPYARARAARDAVEGARADIAHLMGAKPDGITFTAGATEANNLAFAATDGGVVTDAAEHESVLACAQARGAVVVGVGADGRVDPERLCAAIGPTTQLVSVELANGEVGAVQPRARDSPAGLPRCASSAWPREAACPSGFTRTPLRRQARSRVT
jgi:cysteine desulfurase